MSGFSSALPILGGILSMGASIAAATQKPDEPKSPEKQAVKPLLAQRQMAARSQGLSSLILTRGRAPLGGRNAPTGAMGTTLTA